MIGTKFIKSKFNGNDYEKAANWCNANGATIEDKGDYYEVVAISAPSLEELKEQKLFELKTIRDTAEVEPITYQGYSFDYDDKARERINAAIIALNVQTQARGQTASIDWTTADNNDVKVTADDLRAVIALVANRSNALHVAYRVAKEKIEAATTVAEVKAITLEV